jgi:hypothetical protein
MAEVNDVGALLEALAKYRAARTDFLDALGCRGSNRDPFAEFGECLALVAIGGSMATSRTQKGWDFTDPAGQRVQVRYLANPQGPWVNEHLVDFRSGGCDRYALLVVEAFEPKALLVFDGDHMASVGAALGKRHGDQERTLQLTQVNYKALMAAPGAFAELGVQVLNLSQQLGP